MKRIVVITGIGMVTPLGNTALKTWTALVAGASGIRRITKFDTSAFPCRIAGELKGFDPLAFMTAKEALRTDPFIQYALAAAMMAVEDSRLTFDPRSAIRIGPWSVPAGAASRQWRRTWPRFKARGPGRSRLFIRPCRS